MTIWILMTLMVGNPGETDDDVRATLDLVYEMERRGLFAFLVPSIFTPLHDTRMAKQEGISQTRQLRPLQWQLMMKCWKMNLRPGRASALRGAVTGAKSTQNRRRSCTAKQTSVTLRSPRRSSANRSRRRKRSPLSAVTRMTTTWSSSAVSLLSAGAR